MSHVYFNFSINLDAKWPIYNTQYENQECDSS